MSKGINGFSVGPGGVSGLPGLPASAGEQAVCLVVSEGRIPGPGYQRKLRLSWNEMATRWPRDADRWPISSLELGRPPERTQSSTRYSLSGLAKELSHACQQPAGGDAVEHAMIETEREIGFHDRHELALGRVQLRRMASATATRMLEA